VTLASVTAQDPLAGFCIARTLPLEGGLADNPADPGCVTNHGISLRWALSEIAADPSSARGLDIDHDGHVDRRDIIGLTADDAADIYYADWWLPGWYRRLSPEMVAWKCFDIAVNTGPKRASVILQKALARVGVNVARVAGLSGEIVGAVQAQAAQDDGEALLQAIRAEQRDYYERLIALEPKLSVFRHGWLSRAAT
jgi:lysozyme family protein